MCLLSLSLSLFVSDASNWTFIAQLRNKIQKISFVYIIAMKYQWQYSVDVPRVSFRLKHEALVNVKPSKRCRYLKKSWWRKKEGSQITRHRTHYLYLIDLAPLKQWLSSMNLPENEFKSNRFPTKKTGVGIEKRCKPDFLVSLLNSRFTRISPLERINLFKQILQLHFRLGCHAKQNLRSVSANRELPTYSVSYDSNFSFLIKSRGIIWYVVIVWSVDFYVKRT